VVDVPGQSVEDDLGSQIEAVASAGGQVRIVGNDSKAFYGRAVDAVPLEVGLHRGVIDYDPAELVITLRSGCRLAEIIELLRENRQMFAFEPPDFDGQATVGGMIASGLAGPRRAYAGAVRDFVLGVKMIDGRGDLQRFGGRVIKNVAGFDVARLMVGAQGTLGVLLEVSLRVVPIPETEVTLAFEHADADTHIHWVNQLAGRPLPISASMWCGGVSRIRLSGSAQGVGQAANELGGDTVDDGWDELTGQQHEFFAGDDPLTRISLPPTASDLGIDAPQLIEWGGAQRWYRGAVDVAVLRGQIEARGGNLCAYRHHADEVPVFHPLPQAMLKLQRGIKSSFDPAGIFNPGRIYPEL
jgi:glycolate oxidase FAD binding subunit